MARRQNSPTPSEGCSPSSTALLDPSWPMVTIAC
jgi:hypothetical protein